MVKGTAAEFVAAKLKERDERHARAGASRYLVEPNVKEGKGGLRDLHTLFWIAQYLHPPDSVDAVVQLDLFDRREVRAFIRAFDFLWAVAATCTSSPAGRRNGSASICSPSSPAAWAIATGATPPAVERFMRRYFLIAKEVGALTRAFSAKLEGEQAKHEPRGLSRLLGQRRGPRKPLG